MRVCESVIESERERKSVRVCECVRVKECEGV